MKIFKKSKSVGQIIRNHLLNFLESWVIFLSLAKVLILACMIVAITFVPITYAVEVNLSQKTPMNSAIRSAIFPGWGQHFNGQKTKGYILIGSEVVTLTSTILFYNQAEATYKKYEEKGIKDDPLYNEYSNQMDYVTIGTVLSFGVWVYAIVDAYLVCDKQMKEQSASVFRNIALTLTKNEAKLKYKILF